ncbi:MAG: ATP-binding cassette domain-containing protein [Opitutaceae bacterium]|jgi:NitT/TauT family transport system permease protein|nr:ATP-binding cassette domain-containing protein [Opitutaceae bacterium]
MPCPADTSLSGELAPVAPSKLSVRGVGKSFQTSGRPVRALDNLSLEVADGEFVCLLGPSGCGKSTLLNILAGLDRADEGRVLADGRPVSGPGRDRMVMFQDAALFPWLKTLANVRFGLRHKPNLTRTERTRVAEFYLSLVGLENFAGACVHELSGGMRQRAALARALAPNPRVLLMDEPFAALDAMTREQLYRDLQRVWEQRRKTILFVTHNVREAVCLGDRVVLLSPRPGRVLREFPVNLPRPRDINSDAVVAHAREITAALKETLPDARRHEAGEARPPAARQAAATTSRRPALKRPTTALVFFAALLTTWELVCRAGVWPEVLLPPPSAVGRYLWNATLDGTLPAAGLVTLRRLLLGYACGVLIGLPLGLLSARFRAVNDTLGLVSLGLQTLPSVCWVPLALLWFGQTEAALFFVVIMGTVWSMILATETGVRNAPPLYARAARTMGATGLQTWLRVILPASLPFVVSGMKQSWAFAWRSLMAAEIFVTILSGFGLGQLLHYGRELHAMDAVIGVMGVIVLVGLLADKILFSPWERLMHRRWGTDARP